MDGAAIPTLVCDATVALHRPLNDRPHPVRRLDKMPVGKVRIARRCPVPPMAEQLADQRQVLARHDGLTRRRMTKVMQAKPAELRVYADRASSDNKAVRIPALGKFREQERIGATLSGQRVDLRPRGLAERHRTRAGLGVRQVECVAANVAPA